MEPLVVGLLIGMAYGFAFMAVSLVLVLYAILPRRQERLPEFPFMEANGNARVEITPSPVETSLRGPKSRTMWDLPEKPARGA